MVMHVVRGSGNRQRTRVNKSSGAYGCRKIENVQTHPRNVVLKHPQGLLEFATTTAAVLVVHILNGNEVKS